MNKLLCLNRKSAITVAILAFAGAVIAFAVPGGTWYDSNRKEETALSNNNNGTYTMTVQTDLGYVRVTIQDEASAQGIWGGAHNADGSMKDGFYAES